MTGFGDILRIDGNHMIARLESGFKSRRIFHDGRELARPLALQGEPEPVLASVQLHCSHPKRGPFFGSSFHYFCMLITGVNREYGLLILSVVTPPLVHLTTPHSFEILGTCTEPGKSRILREKSARSQFLLLLFLSRRWRWALVMVTSPARVRSQSLCWRFGKSARNFKNQSHKNQCNCQNSYQSAR